MRALFLALLASQAHALHPVNLFSIKTSGGGPAELVLFDKTEMQRQVARGINGMQRQLESNPERRKLLTARERLFERIDGIRLRRNKQEPARVDLILVLSTGEYEFERAFAASDVDAGKLLMVEIPNASKALGPYSVSGAAKLSLRYLKGASKLTDVRSSISVDVDLPIVGATSDRDELDAVGTQVAALPKRPRLELDPSVQPRYSVVAVNLGLSPRPANGFGVFGPAANDHPRTDGRAYTDAHEVCMRWPHRTRAARDHADQDRRPPALLEARTRRLPLDARRRSPPPRPPPRQSPAAATGGADDGTVLVQAAQTVTETDFLRELADAPGSQVLGIVGWVDHEGTGARRLRARAEYVSARLARMADQRAPQIVFSFQLKQNLCVTCVKLSHVFEMRLIARRFTARIGNKHLKGLNHASDRHPIAALSVAAVVAASVIAPASAATHHKRARRAGAACNLRRCRRPAGPS